MHTDRIRPAAVAGMFYPADSRELTEMVDGMLARATAKPPFPPKAIMVPHAGYIYSGPTAALAYAALDRERIKRVVLLGPAHRVPLHGLALPDADAFATPLGTLPIDRTAAGLAAELPQVSINADTHAWEHSLEVQLPFLQRALGDVSIIPFVVGEATAAEVAEVIDTLWGGEETLIVISSDLSHFLTYEAAIETDMATVESILKLRMPIRHSQACGATPLNGLLYLTGKRALRPQLLELCNSGDTAGDRERVVGYASILFEEHDG
jgi:hypothetical protein